MAYMTPSDLHFPPDNLVFDIRLSLENWAASRRQSMGFGVQAPRDAVNLWRASDGPVLASTISVMRQRSAVAVPTEDELLFQTLDHRLVKHHGRYWRLSVCGIVSNRGYRWVQMRLAGTPECLLTVRLGITADASEYCAAVAAWLDGSDASDGTVSTSAAFCARPTESASSRHLWLVR